MISVANGPEAERTVAEDLTEMNFWLVCQGVGTFDISAVATVGSNRDADDLISRVRSHDQVDGIDYSIETARGINIDNYLAL